MSDPFAFPVHRCDLGAVPDAAVADDLATRLRRGAVLDADVLRPAECTALVDEVLALQRSRFDPAERHFTEILVAETEASFGWGTDGAHGLEVVDLSARCPTLERVARRALALDRALRPGQRGLLSITPSMRKARSFPRFYHQDSPHRPHCYEMVWDLGLERAGEVLDVHFVPRAAFETDGERDGRWDHLFQQAEFVDHYALTDAEIDARQRQVRADVLPSADTTQLENGRALIWIDDLFYHSTWLRAGRDLSELEARGRSILIVRAFLGHDAPTLPDPVRLAELLGFEGAVGT